MSVSVVIAAHNAGPTIERAIISALHQTIAPHEVIVVDDVSEDQTPALVQRMAEADPRVRLFKNGVNKGPGGSRNAGFRVAEADWVAVLDADDAWCENRLESMLAAAAQHDVEIVTDNQLLYDCEAAEVTRTGFATSRGLRWITPLDVFQNDVQLGSEFGFGLLKPMIRLDFLRRHDLAYDETLRYGEDVILLLDMLFSGARAIILSDPLYIYTTRIGEKTGKTSPHSKSIPRFDQIADRFGGLRSKYPAQISPKLDQAITKLSKRYRDVHATNLARQTRRQKGLLPYAADLCRNPRVVAQVTRHQYWKLLAK